MSFFGKLKSNATPSNTSTSNATAKKDANIAPPTALEKALAEVTGPPRLDGSDKFFGFENYSSTCYCNSIIQCLYYSAPFRENVINFPPPQLTNGLLGPNSLPPLKTGATVIPRSPLTSKPPPTTPGPLAANSPARKPVILPGTPAAQTAKADDKDGPDYKKKLLMQSGPILDMQLDYSDGYGMSESLFTALKDIFEAVIAHPQRTGVVSPHKFLEILRKENEMFRSAMHQDAHEFLNLVLNSVLDNVDAYSRDTEAAAQIKNVSADQSLVNAVSNVAKTTGANASGGWVHNLFEGLLTSETRCLTCENTSQRDEPFMDLSVDLEAHSSVTSCLRKFSEEEMLCERNKFHCDNCGGLQEAEKRMKIKRLPRILALHLKRFKYTEDYNRLQKLFHRVVYPYHLRLFNTTDDAEDPDRLYELYAVVVHIGGGPYHGHYVSIIKTQDRGWLLFDDELVEPVDKNYVQNFFGGEAKPGVQDAKHLACAYVLFYQETTLEAVQREQEAENRAAESQAADVFNMAAPTTPLSPGGFFGNGLRHAPTATSSTMSPTAEDEEHFIRLAHASTAPAVSPPIRVGLDPLQASPQMSSARTKMKETKKEKETRKAAEKEAERVAHVKRQEALVARRERWKQADDEMKAALEASRTTKAEEDKRLPTPAAPASATAANGGAGAKESPKDSSSSLSRFRGTSMSMRQKPRWLAKDKDGGGGGSPTLPSTAENGGAVGSPVEKEAKKSRFSLGRKKTDLV